MARISKNIDTLEAVPSSLVWRAGLYLRLSKEDGDKEEGDKEESDSICNQKFLIEDFLIEHPDINIAETYTDDGFSGANFDRPNFNRLIDDIRLGKINCVIVKDLSRFGRNYIEAGQYLQVFFPVMNTRFIAINDYVDSFLDPNSINCINISFKNVMNEEYCRDLSIKVRSILSMKRENGEYLGSSPYGYKKDLGNRNKLIIDDEAAKIVKLIFKLFLEGNVLFAIARKLNELGIPNPAARKGIKFRQKKNSGQWSTQTVRCIISNRMLTGDLVQGKQEKISHKIDKFRAVKENAWIVVENTHEAIIDKITFNNVQQMLKKRDTHFAQDKGARVIFWIFKMCGLWNAITKKT